MHFHLMLVIENMEIDLSTTKNRYEMVGKIEFRGDVRISQDLNLTLKLIEYAEGIRTRIEAINDTCSCKRCTPCSDHAPHSPKRKSRITYDDSIWDENSKKQYCNKYQKHDTRNTGRKGDVLYVRQFMRPGIDDQTCDVSRTNISTCKVDIWLERRSEHKDSASRVIELTVDTSSDR